MCPEFQTELVGSELSARVLARATGPRPCARGAAADTMARQGRGGPRSRELSTSEGDGAPLCCAVAKRECARRARVAAAARVARAGAVVGVSIFAHSVPESFGAFDAAFMTLFYVTGGDPWPDALPKNNEDGWAYRTILHSAHKMTML